jgi:transcriptional regulator with XRE-family HTH domain
LTHSDNFSLTSFGRALREARLEAGLTQDQLSELSKVSRRTIIRWEGGEVSPWIPELQSAIKALEISEPAAAGLLGLLKTSRGQFASDAKATERQAHFIRLARVRADLDRGKLAAIMRCDRSTIARWEAGRLCPKPDELELLWATLDMQAPEVAELAEPPDAVGPRGDVDLEERIEGIVWPWDKEGYLLFDCRFFKLIEQLNAVPDSDQRQVWICRAKTAYAWMLSTCERYREAQEFSDAVIALFERGEIPSAPYLFLSMLISAKCSYRSLSHRGISRGIERLDRLEKRPLDWELLACRFDAYAEAYACQRSFSKALECCDQAIDAAAKCGPRLTRLTRFNKSRVLLMSGKAEAALEHLPEFSELTPVNDAREALTLALVNDALGRTPQADHWRSVANRVIDTFQLSRAFGRRPYELWGSPPLLSSM